MRRALLLLALAACEGPRGPAGPPGATPDGGARDAVSTDAGPMADAGPPTDAALDAASTPVDATPTPDSGACPPWTPPPGLGGPAAAIVSVEEAARWRRFRAAREQERMREAWDPATVQARYRVEQADIAAGCVPFEVLVDLGRGLFMRSFTPAEGYGDGTPGLRRFQVGHAGGPDASRCLDCHWKGGFAGAGDRADNAYAFGDGEHLVAHDARNPPALWGVGWAELLAREMSAELRAQAEAASRAAAAAGEPVEARLSAKGVGFGRVIAWPDGTLNTAGVEGVDADLVIRPFGWKGSFATLRDFAGSSLHLHLGMQAEERVAAPGALTLGDGPAEDPDDDGISREITEGQLTALVLFLATLDAPRTAVPVEAAAPAPPLSGEVDLVDAPEFTERWLQGAARFTELGCVGCHIPYLPLEDSRYQTTAALSGHTVTLDLAAAGAHPRPTRDDAGIVWVPSFSDFKRHAMGPRLASRHAEGGVPVDRWLTRRLWGVANTGPYLHDGSATTFDEAIGRHGGEATFAAEGFAALSPHDKASLRVFLLGLRRGPAIRIR